MDIRIRMMCSGYPYYILEKPDVHNRLLTHCKAGDLVGELTALKKDRSLLQVQLSANLIYNASGTPIGMMHLLLISPI